MKVLGEFVKDDISDISFPYVAPLLLPALIQIFKSPATYPPKIRAKSVTIIKDFIEIIYMVNEEHPEAVSGYIEPIVQDWVPALLEALQGESTASNICICIKNEALKVYTS